MSDMLSPGVYTREFDQTFNITNIVSNATGYVGLFKWGPAYDPIRITTNESELVNRFGRPDNATTLYFHSALNYLLYTNPLIIVRAIDEALAKNAVPVGETPVLVKNDFQYDNVNLTGLSFIGRYVGDLANGLIISVADSTDYENWEYSGNFEYAPQAGEFNIVVVDGNGTLTGSVGTILEQYELMTLNPTDKKGDGTSAYIGKVLQEQSNLILLGDISVIQFDAVTGIYEVELTGGVDANDPFTADFESAWDIFSNDEVIDVIRVFTSGSTSLSIKKSIDVCEFRKDCISFSAPELSDVYNVLSPEDSVSEFFTVTINKNSSYAFYVDNWKLVNDKYNDKNIWIPTDSDAAAIHARTFSQTEGWYPPAGLARGQLKNIIKLAWNPNKSQRDKLYKNSVNSIVAFPGEGTVLWGDKTALRRPSAFSRINVRTLFIIIKKNISRAARYQLFELNDFITRSIFRNATTAYLETVQARRGVTSFRVVCDETNNTPQIIDSHEFIGDIFVAPTRSINFIRLNFVAVATGVDFSEVELSE